MRRRSGRAHQRRRQPRRRHHVQLHVQPVRQPHRRVALALGHRPHHRRIRDEVRDHRRCVVAGDHEVDVASRLLPAPQRSRQLDALHGGMIRQIRLQRLGVVERVDQAHARVAPLPALDALEDLLLGLFAVALERAQLADLARLLEPRHTVDAQRRRQLLNLLQAQPRHLGQLQRPLGHFLAQPLELLRSPGQPHLGDGRRQRRPDAGDRGQPLLVDERAQLVAQLLDRARTGLVRARAKLVLSLELEHQADLAQRASDRELVDHEVIVGRNRIFTGDQEIRRSGGQKMTGQKMTGQKMTGQNFVIF